MKFNTNTILLIAITVVLVVVIYLIIRPPLWYSASEYSAQPAVICPGQPVRWVSELNVTANGQPADLVTARDVWDVERKRRPPGLYQSNGFLVPLTVTYTISNVLSDTARLLPGEYIVSRTTGGRLTTRTGYIVRFRVRAC